MNIKRVGVLLTKDLIQGPKSFIFILVVVAPVVMSLAVSLVFGTLFSETPKLGIVDEGNSQVVTKTKKLTSVVVSEYDTVGEMRGAVESGALDMGVVLPQDFDLARKQGFSIPINDWVARGPWRHFFREVLLDPSCMFHPASVERVLTGLERGYNNGERLFCLLIMELWRREYGVCL